MDSPAGSCWQFKHLSLYSLQISSEPGPEHGQVGLPQPVHHGPRQRHGAHPRHGPEPRHLPGQARAARVSDVRLRGACVRDQVNHRSGQANIS